MPSSQSSPSENPAQLELTPSLEALDHPSDKTVINKHILSPNIKRGVDKFLGARFRVYKNRCYNYYKKKGGSKGARQHPYGISRDNWELICNHFETEKFMKRSKINTNNRAQLKTNHTGGSKSFAQRLYEMTDPETQQELDYVVFYKEVHVNKHMKKWVTPECEHLYDNMVCLSNPTEGDNTPSLTPNEAFFETLGSRPGYVIGLGHGELPEPSARARRLVDLEAIRRVEQAESVVAELRTEVQVLRGTIETQETSMQDMRGTIQTMEARQIKMEQMFQAFMSGQPPPSH